MKKFKVSYAETVFYDVEVEAEDKKEAIENANDKIMDMSKEEWIDLFMGGESNIDEVYAEEIE